MKSIQRALGKTLLLLTLAGCGRAPEAAAPSPPSEPAPLRGGLGAAESVSEPRTLAEAEALLERSRTELERLGLAPSELEADSGSSPAAAAPSQAPEPSLPEASSAPKRAQTSRSEEARESQDKDDAASDCTTACKALSSLERASDAVCRLDTEGGARCARARRIREDARQRVASCACPK